MRRATQVKKETRETTKNTRSKKLINQRAKDLEKIKLHLLEQDLKASGISRSQILSNLSHEIKTPLNTIISAAEVLKVKLANSKEMNLAESIYSSGNHLSILLNNVLDFYKTSFIGLSLDSHPFDLYFLFDELHHVFHYPAKQKSVKLSFSIDPNIQRLWNGDAARIKQMIYNLLDNAFKFTHEGEISLSAHLEEGNDNTARIKFRITDTGSGINPVLKDDLWHFFSSPDVSNSRTQQGLGMGLALTKTIAQLMNGSIELKESGTNGTTIELTISLEKESNDGLLNIQLFKNILLAEDNKVNQQLAKNLLEKQGFQVDVANNGEEAVELFRTHKYNLILMDIQMPKWDGVQATKEIRSIEKKNKILAPIKIIALTANAQKQDKIDCLSAGMDEYMRKPLDIYNLTNILCLLQK